MRRGDDREGDDGQRARKQGRERVQIFFRYDGIASGTGECVREGVRTGGKLLWPEIINNQEGRLEDPCLNDLDLDVVRERRG